MKKKEITKPQSHLEEKNRLRHEISWLSNRLNQRNKSDDETTVNDNAGDTDNSATFTTVLYKKHSATTKGKKPRKKPTKTNQPQSCRPTTPSTPVLTDNAVTTRPKTEVANLRKSATLGLHWIILKHRKRRMKVIKHKVKPLYSADLSEPA